MRIALALAAVLLAATGCGETEGAEDTGATDDGTNTSTPESHYSFWQETPNGDVLCVWAKDGYGGGLSCDWHHLGSN